MKLKSTTYHWLAAASGTASLLYGMGLEGSFQTGGTVSDGAFATALCLVLATVMFLRLGFAAEDRERAAKRRKYGKINRIHARNAEYPQDQERGA